MAASKSWDLFHIHLKTPFLRGQSYDVNRDVVCQLPPEAGHPPHTTARLKKPANGMNDAPRRWWNILDKALRNYGMVRPLLLRAVFDTVAGASLGTLGTQDHRTAARHKRCLH